MPRRKALSTAPLALLLLQVASGKVANYNTKVMSEQLTHLDEHGRARMVDVGHKDDTVRVATARGSVHMQPETIQRIIAGQIEKGNIITTAELAGVMAAKRTSDLIPMCHPLQLSSVKVRVNDLEDGSGMSVTAEVATTGPTGVEMEALTAVSVACLTIYDMLKAVDRAMRIECVMLTAKSGGASGDYKAG